MWKYAYQVSENKKIRVIVHTDCKNEADDQFALAHHLMTPKFDVRGIVAGHFCKNPQEYGEENTAKASYDEVIRMMELMGIEGEYPVALGASKGNGRRADSGRIRGRQIYYRRSFESG